MASITVRNLDETVKQALRLRAARHDRSMEEEARLLLADGVGEPDQRPMAAGGSNLPKPVGGADPDHAYPARGKRILLIIGGGIAAYKCLDLIRRLRERGVSVRPVLTRAGGEFVTPLSLGALAADRVFTDLFDREDEHDVGHIRLSREADLIVVAPATADFLAKMAGGHADDLASTVVLASDKPILVAPAMNPKMWQHPATVRNYATLESDGVHFIGPEAGEMAESDEAGTGRMAEPMAIVERIGVLLDTGPKPLAGRIAIVTSGPTHEPIDPVRYIANRSSGKQGHAIAAALARAGAQVKLISGPVNIADPAGVEVIHVETARQMHEAALGALPADIAVMVAAVADWRTDGAADEKIKKTASERTPRLALVENPDILAAVGHHERRPCLVVGFAAETEKIDKHGRGKLERKNADWIVANDVSPETGVMGGDANTIRLIRRDGIEAWPTLSKQAVAERLTERVVDYFAENTAHA